MAQVELGASRGRRPLAARAALLSALALAAAALLLAATGCEHSVGLVDPGASDSTETGGEDVVQRATLVVTVSVAPDDSALARRLGLPGDALPGAEVRIERLGSTEGEQTARADAAGRAEFERLLPGRYAVSALRPLTAEEQAHLGPEDADVTGFGGGLSLTVEAPSTGATLEAVAGRRGSLVISELSFMMPPLFEAGTYFLGHYVELYNNADTTIYLDGKVIIKGIVWVRDFQNEVGCEPMKQWREDPDGLWTRWIYAFPGSGRNYPLRPGEAVVVATDAIDHREIHPSLLDLSDADFEFMGPADVDNPSVPNMRTVGDDWSPSLFGHGLYLTIINEILAVGEPVNLSALPVDFLPVLTPRFWRVPKEQILDVVTLSKTPEKEAALPYAPCQRFVHESFDRQFAQLIDQDKRNAILRRVFATLPDGRKILQRTKTSSRDFRAGAPSPGWIPD